MHSHTFTESRVGHADPSPEEINEAFERFCHSETELNFFYEDALKPSASPSPRHGPMSPRHTPLMRGVLGHGQSHLKLESEIPTLGLPEGKLALGGGQRAVSYAAGTGSTTGSVSGGDGNKGDGYETSRRASMHGS